ncbi:MAG: HupE/UreJ family protein [Rhodobacteraceae bacterium]|nr:HupE/UreJ family protein [Paracoccaceae bacterium]
MIRLVLRFFGLALLLAAWALPASSHALEPGYLELSPLHDDTWRIVWHRPDVGGRPMAIDARLSPPCSPEMGPAPIPNGRGWQTEWIARCPGGLAGVTVSIEGLDAQATDVLVRFDAGDGQGGTRRLVPATPSFVIPAEQGAFGIFQSYTLLGIHHILFGFDHLLFVFALLLLIRSGWRLAGAITAFTLAHSLTLGAAALGWLAVPGPPVEAVIALSIMFVAAEVAQHRDGQPRLSERAPWIVAFSFGLIHGLGFGSALKQVGLPEHDLVLALFAFNAGVEIGQLSFVAVLLLFWSVLRALAPTASWSAGRPALAYGIGAVAAFWFVERVAAF